MSEAAGGGDGGTPPPRPERPRVDPWEARERERARYNRKDRSSSSSPRRNTRDEEPFFTDEIGLRENYLGYGLITSILLLFISEIPRIPTGGRTLLTQIGTGLVLLLLGTCKDFRDDIRTALRRGPNPFLVLLLLWSLVELYLAPYKAYAVGDMLRVVSGLGVYFLAAYTLKTPRQTGSVAAALLLFGVLVSLWDLSQIGQGGGLYKSLSTEYSSFGTHENVGSLLVLMLPVALAFALHTGIEEKRRLAAAAASLVLGAMLLVARTRSAWLGGLVALIVLAVLTVKFGPREERRKGDSPLKRTLSSPITIVALGFLLFVGVAGLGPLVMKRASLMGALEDRSLAGRLTMWRGGALMATQKPLVGWGLGSYLVTQGLWTHAGDEIVQVLREGAFHQNIAHNYYVQWLADTGVVGLTLHVGAIVAFLLVAYRGLKEAKSPFAVALLCGAIATVSGALVDAIASPAYNFHGVNAVFWAWVGLGVAALRPEQKGENPPPATAVGPQPVAVPVIATIAGLFVSSVILGYGYYQVGKGRTAPLGTLAVIPDPLASVKRGATVTWRAIYTAPNGRAYDTMPGTIWRVQLDPNIQRQAETEWGTAGTQGYLFLSVFRVHVPNIAGKIAPITVTAYYRDEYGRVLTATSTVAVE